MSLRDADGRLVLTPMRNLGPREGYTFDVDRAVELTDRDPAAVGRAIRRALPAKGDPELEQDLRTAAEWIADALAEDTGRRLFALGVYVGTILEREAGGRWRTGDADGDDVPMDLADGSTVWPIRRAIDRFELGSEAGIAAYVASVTGDARPRGLRRLLRR